MAGLDSSAAAEEAGGGNNSASSGSTPSLDTDVAGRTKGGGVVATPNKEGTVKKINLGLKMSFRTLSSPKKQEKDKNEPSRFLGEGVSFKAKLIGILEVNEARGDRMCQEALADLKMAIRAAGEHKQRININIAIDGLRLRDEKNGDCLYHHPVHKISFIAQDMSDSRAFGYIFGSPDTGHRFFGIKTDKAASQVVIAMRDLFQVVFELKKKEIEMAKQHIEQHQIKITGGIFTDSGSSIHKNGVGVNSDQSSSKMRTISETSAKETDGASSAKSAHQTSEVIADLLDLEFELNSIQQGIHQMERITPSDPFGPGAARDGSFRGGRGADPFGDSFSPATAIPPPPKSVRQPAVAILLPPPSSGREPPPRATPADPFNPPPRQPHRRGGVRARTSANKNAYQNEDAVVRPPAAMMPPPPPEKEKHWFDQETESIFGEGELVTPPFSSSATTTVFPSLNDQVVNDLSKTPPPHQAEPFDVFTDLDPLGTGRSKPYIDRKDFFQELKNPPKKVLKDLVSEAPTEATAPLFQATFDSGRGTASRQGEGSDPRSVPFAQELVFPRRDPDPFEEGDPFFGSDPFDDDDAVPFPPVSGGADPFDTEFADFTTFGGGNRNRFPLSADSISSQEPDLERISPLLSDPNQSVFSSRSNFHGPLRVSLPPEKSGVCPEGSMDAPPLPLSGRRPSGGLAKPRGKTRLQKQTTMSSLVKLPSPKSSGRSGRLAKQTTVDAKSRTLHPNPGAASPPNPRRSPASHLESVTLRMRCSVTPSPPGVACFPGAGDTSRLSGSSAELSDIAPEPPPRPASNIAPIKPPPLPPKKQQSAYVVRPPPRPPHTDDPTHYDYIENYETSASPTPRNGEEVQSPPIPVPARRPRFGLDDLGSAPQRPRRHHPVALSLSNKSNEEDYLTPIPFPLLPPPQKRNQDANKTQTPSPNTNPLPTLLHSSTSATSRPPEDPKTKRQESTSTSTSLNITLSQLTKTGFSDLATTLGISPGQLSNMTLQDLTRCLAKLSSEEQVQEEPREEIKPASKEPARKDKRDKYATLRESVDEEPIFKAEFETNFDDAEPNEKALEDVFQETLFDKYAVFRELINEEKTEEQLEVAEEETETGIMNETNQKELEVEDLEDLETKVENSIESTALSKETEDRYAALRDITFEDCEPEEGEPEEGEPEEGEPEEGEPLSDKEESLAEGTQVEEDYDLLTLSRQHSESTESPTMETATMREPQSIIETTIYEEDVSALEADNDDNFEDVPDIVDDVEDLEDVSKESTECVESKESLDQEQMPAESMNHSSSSEKEEIKDLSVETKSKNEENSESWAKFDACTFPPEKSASEGQGSEGGASPWSSDGKEFGKVKSPSWQEPCNQEQDTQRRRRTQPSSPWREEGSEEGWDGPWEERPWRENGWSEDGESYYEDAPPRKGRTYHEDRRGRRRRVSPWKKGQKTSRDTSPWEQGRRPEGEEWVNVKRYQERSMDVDDEEEYECYWKTRPKHRGPSWDDERRRRFESRELNGLDYEEGRKRRPSPWGGGEGGGERRSSRESISWDEEDRFSQREYGDRRPRDREGEYRWRREQEMDARGYAWVRKAGADEEYTRREPARRKPENRRYYRDQSRESPWEDEYSEQGDAESPQYQGKARSWSSKRPGSSASDARRPSDKSPGEYKARSVDKPQYSLPASSRQDSGEKMGLAEKRYKEKCGIRPRSREDHFNSDQEYEYWPQSERARRESGGYEQRSQTLHSRRSGKYKKGQERSYSQKSPFEDDFASHALSFGADFKTQGGESDTSDNVRKKSPVNPSRLFTYTDAFPRRRDQPPNDIRPTDIVPSSPLESQESPREDSRSRASRGSCNRQSPFEDDFTPPETRPPSGRLASSVSSDVSDQRRSPYRVPSVAEESENAENANGRYGDDVFLPGDDGDKRFADFENDAFPGGSAEFVPSRPAVENRRLDRRVGWNSEDAKRSEKCAPLTKSRIGSLRSDPANIKKSESVNIFRRENDPFDDDFFSGDAQPPGFEKPRPRPDQLRMTTDQSNNNSDPFKWTKAFESFNFDKEQ